MVLAVPQEPPGRPCGWQQILHLFHYEVRPRKPRGGRLCKHCQPTCLPKPARDISARPGLAILQGTEAENAEAFGWALPEDLTAPTDRPLYLSNRLRVEYLLFPSLLWVICPKRSDIAMKCHLVRKFSRHRFRFAFEMERGGQSPI